MIQDIYPDHFYNQYRPEAKPDMDSPIVLIRGGEILLKVAEDGALDYPRLGDLRGLDAARPEALTYLFAVNEEEFFLADLYEGVPEDWSIPGGFSWQAMNTVRRQSLYPQSYVLALFTIIHLVSWYRANRYCGKCGGALTNDVKERARFCPACGNKIYPRINPAVIIGVTNGDRLLITKYRTGYGYSALVAGFTEIGETLEETVAREVMEEAGIRVKNIRYYKSQPWGVADDVLMGFYCDVDGDDSLHMDTGELKYEAWVPREEIVLQPQNYSLTNEMMRMFKEGKEPR
ncbi:MAG: NAD(+) diphosphatase [Clostridia bacterium]|nr:NAD(+) diphosphatase [Clostridia bacterium]